MTYSVNLIAHVRAIRDCLPKFEARAKVNMETLHLTLKARGHYVELSPQFTVPREGSIAFASTMLAEIEGFIGWRAYFNRVWPLSYNKREFKEFCRSNNLCTPREWSAPGAVEADALVKRAVSSFSDGISSPMSPAMLTAAPPSLQPQTDFFEEFIRGDILKVWYWNEVPAALEVLPMPTVTGDGTRTLRQLINRKKFPAAPDDPMWEAMARWQGLSMDTVVPTGKEVLVEFRYRSSLHSPLLTDLNVIDKYADTPVMRQLVEAGPIFFHGIPEHIRQDTLYTIDAIIDAQQSLHYLEMNCNPAVHPDTYIYMFESFFGAPVGARAPVTQLHSRTKVAAAG